MSRFGLISVDPWVPGPGSFVHYFYLDHYMLRVDILDKPQVLGLSLLCLWAMLWNSPIMLNLCLSMPYCAPRSYLDCSIRQSNASVNVSKCDDCSIRVYWSFITLVPLQGAVNTNFHHVTIPLCTIQNMQSFWQ